MSIAAAVVIGLIGMVVFPRITAAVVVIFILAKVFL